MIIMIVIIIVVYIIYAIITIYTYYCNHNFFIYFNLNGGASFLTTLTLLTGVSSVQISLFRAEGGGAGAGAGGGAGGGAGAGAGAGEPLYFQ